jgi:hypothetical protein
MKGIFLKTLCTQEENYVFFYFMYIPDFYIFPDSVKDMRRLPRAAPLPFLPVILCTIDSALLYTMVARNRNTIWPSPPQHSLHRRAALITNSNGTQSAGGLDTSLMSMVSVLLGSTVHVDSNSGERQIYIYKLGQTNFPTELCLLWIFGKQTTIHNIRNTSLKWYCHEILFFFILRLHPVRSLHDTITKLFFSSTAPES